MFGHIVKWTYFVNTNPRKCVAFGTGLFDGTLLVPHSQTSERIQNTTAGFIEEIGSYMIYNVFLVSRPTFPPCSHPHT